MNLDHLLLQQIRAQIVRLKESTARLEAYTALQIDHDAVRDECKFIRQTVYGIEQLNQNARKS